MFHAVLAVGHAEPEVKVEGLQVSENIKEFYKWLMHCKNEAFASLRPSQTFFYFELALALPLCLFLLLLCLSLSLSLSSSRINKNSGACVLKIIWEPSP